MNRLFLRSISLHLAAAIFLATAAVIDGWSAKAGIVAAADLEGPAHYGLEQLEYALQSQGYTIGRDTALSSDHPDFYILAGLANQPSPALDWLQTLNIQLPQKPESVVVHQTIIQGVPTLLLWGQDSRGLMYAALDTANRIGWAHGQDSPFHYVRNTVETPHVKERAVSMYTMHRKLFENRLYDENYWKHYFGMLAESRINSFVVIFGYENGGFMAPAYPYFFDVEGFPNVQFYQLSDQQQKRNVAAFRKMIQIAHQRGIEIRVGLWDHIYRGGVQSGGIPGADEKAGQKAPHLVYGLNADNLIAYNQAALSQLLDVFPELDALQFRMHGESGLERGEMDDFWHNIFAMIAEKAPTLHVDIRAKELPDSIIQDGLNQGVKVRVTTKYWMEQMGLPFHPTHINEQNQDDRRHGYADLLTYPQKYKVHWRLWNGGTTRFLLWGDPDYVRRFVKTTEIYNGDSFEVNEMLATKMLSAPHDAEPFDLLSPNYQFYQYEFERYWHYYQVWGRVGYDPNAANELWVKEFVRRFGQEAGIAVMRGLHAASDVLPRIVAASYLYRYFPTTRGWAEMMRMRDLPEFAEAEGSDIQQFRDFEDYAADSLSGRYSPMRSPDETSRWFRKKSQQIQGYIQQAESAARHDNSAELITTLTDLKILANLALYHARRIPAAVNYNLFEETGDLFAFDRAIAHEARAINAWEQIVQAAGDVYPKKLIFGVHDKGFPYHWLEELERLKQGLQELKEARRKHVESLQNKERFFAHIPVRRLRPGKALELQFTVAGAPASERLRAVVDGDAYALQGADHQYQTVIHPAPPRTEITYYFQILGEDETYFYPGGSHPEPITVQISEDRQPPQVNLERAQQAKPNQDLIVTAHVVDPSGVKSVTLRYRHLTQVEDYQSIEMKRDKQSGVYSAVIPGKFIIPKWDLMYFVEAIDQYGNGRMYPDLAKEMPYIVVELDR